MYRKLTIFEPVQYRIQQCACAYTACRLLPTWIDRHICILHSTHIFHRAYEW